MKLLDVLDFKKRPFNEVSRKEYYSKFLSNSDSEYLQYFVSSFAGVTEIPCAILAVGSSTFPRSYWREVKFKNIFTKNDKRIPDNYRDIDLLIVPERLTPLNELKESVENVLDYLNFEFKLHSDTIMGPKTGYVPSEYGLHSISTNLQNGTPLDLILGREDLLVQTATKKINRERRRNNAFSLLYNPQFINS